LTLAACAILAAPAGAETVSVVGPPQVGHGTATLPVLRASESGCGALRQTSIVVAARVLRRPRALRAGDRLAVRLTRTRARSLRVTRRSGAPSFARVATLFADARAAANDAGRDVAAIAALPPDAAGQRNFASAEQARALGQRLNTLDERLLSLAPALDRAVAAIERAFGPAGRRCPALRRARDRRTRTLRATAGGARRASTGIQAGVSDIDTLLTFLPPDGVELPFGTVGTVTKVIQDLLDLLSDLTGGSR
jgi:hypothetical protein